MVKTALATQISDSLKKELDEFCEERGLTISRLVEEALQQKIAEFREEEVLVNMALERLAEPEEKSFAEYRQLLKTFK